MFKLATSESIEEEPEKLSMSEPHETLGKDEEHLEWTGTPVTGEEGDEVKS